MITNMSQNYIIIIVNKTHIDPLSEENSSIKFIELFMSCGYRHLRNRVLENSQNFLK